MEHSLSKFVARTQDHDAAKGAAVFEVEKENYLKVNMGTKDGTTGDILNQVWIKMGSMVGYQGNVKFKRESIGSHGMSNKVKKVLTGDGLTLTSATSEGIATLFLADEGKNVTVLYLQGESICVEGNKVLAFAPTIKYNVTRSRSISGIASAGFFSGDGVYRHPDERQRAHAHGPSRPSARVHGPAGNGRLVRGARSRLPHRHSSQKRDRPRQR